MSAVLQASTDRLRTRYERDKLKPCKLNRKRRIGLRTAFLQTQQGFLVSDHTYCLECNCDSPSTGCGWLAYGAGRIQCTSCQFLRAITQRLSGAEVSGCGTMALSGEVVYSVIPSLAGVH